MFWRSSESRTIPNIWICMLYTRYTVGLVWYQKDVQKQNKTVSAIILWNVWKRGNQNRRETDKALRTMSHLLNRKGTNPIVWRRSVWPQMLARLSTSRELFFLTLLLFGELETTVMAPQLSRGAAHENYGKVVNFIPKVVSCENSWLLFPEEGRKEAGNLRGAY